MKHRLLFLAAFAAAILASALPAFAANAWTVPGVLRIGVFRDLDNLCPELSGQSAVTDIAHLVFSGLIAYDDRGEPFGDAALEVPTQRNGGISADGKTITYHLRHNVRFSDGVPLTADDVVFTWQAIMNPRNNVPNHNPFDQAVSVRAPDRYTVVVKLKAPSAPFVAEFMENRTQGAILPKHLLSGLPDINHAPYNRRPIGSGPFLIERWEPGSLMVLKPNPYYWRGTPGLREIRYQIIPDQNSLLTVLRSHAIDFYYDVPEQQFGFAKTVAGVTTTRTISTAFEHITFNTRRPLLSDVRVRQAVAYAVDWNALVKNVYHGLDVPGMSDIPPFTWAGDPSDKPYPHDVAKARGLLVQSGWSPGGDGIMQKSGTRLTLVMSTTTGSAIRTNAEVQIQANLREAGIDLQIKNYLPSQLFASKGAGGILNNGEFDLALYGWTKTADPDDTDTISPRSIPPHGANDSFYDDPQIGHWLDEAASHYDRATRHKYYALIIKRMHDQVPLHTVVWKANLHAINTDFHNFKPAPLVTDFWNAWEWQIGEIPSK